MNLTNRFFALLLVGLLSLVSSISTPAHGISQAETNPQLEGKRILNGVVVDEKGEPLPQTTIVLLGTNLGAITNSKGEFVLSLEPDKTYTMRISCIGRQTQTLKIDKSTKAPLRIVLKENATLLNEVVATGMQVVKRQEMTGSAVVLSAKDLKAQSLTSIDRILDGMVVGLNSTTISGAPGMRAQITIRGENSLNGNTEPLWIVDGLPLMTGVPQNNSGNYAATIMQDGVGNIMPQDIESISILKDAAATAVYGARAANGVIVITTKKGFRSKTQVNYSGTITVGTRPSVKLGMMNNLEKLRYERMVVDNYGLDKANVAGRGGYLYKRYLQGYLSETEYNNQMRQLEATNTNWMSEIFRPSLSHIHNINLRGGSEALTYYTSISFNEQKGILKRNKYQNAGLLFNMDYRPVKNAIISLNISLNNRKNFSHASSVDPFNYAIFANPYERPYNDDGSYAYDLSFLGDNYSGITESGYKYDRFNILREMEMTNQEQSGLDGSFALHLQYEPIKGLILKSIMNKSVSYNKDTKEISPETYSSYVLENLAKKAYAGAPMLPRIYDNGELYEAAGRSESWAIRNSIDYNWRINDDHLLTMLGAVEIMSRKFSNFGYNSPVYYPDYRITGLPNLDNRDPKYADMMGVLKSLYNTHDGQDRSVSFLGNVMYNMFQDRYILSFSYRADGADIIGDANRFTPLWSLGLKYNVHNEKLFKLPKQITELALRASYGYTGNIDRTAYPFSVIELSDVFYEGNRVVSNLQFPNPSVSWERKRDLGLGLELGVLHRVFLSLDYYNNRTRNVLTNIKVPPSTGRQTLLANGGVTENKGWEADLRVRWVDTEDFLFSTNFNIAQNKNVIIESEHDFASWQAATYGQVRRGGVINIVGSEIGSIYGWRNAGVNPKTGNPQYYLTEDGKKEYARLLDMWSTLPEGANEKKGVIIEDFHSIPDKVDMVSDEGLFPAYFARSMQYLGRSRPLFVGGFGTYLKYKRIEFTTNWTYKTGHIIPIFSDYIHSQVSMPGAPAELVQVGYTSDLAVSGTNREKRYLGFWKTPGDHTNIPKFVSGGNDYWVGVAKSEQYASGNYVRLNNLSLSYRFEPELLNRLKLSDLQITFIARNLLTLTKYRGLDVATNGAFNYPVAKEYSLRLSLGF